MLLKAWYTSCTCPGADRTRQIYDQAGGVHDFDELRQRAHARKEAYEAARARAAGHSQAEIRDIYLAELNAQGLEEPSDRVLDAIAARIAGNPVPAARLVGEGLVKMGKGVFKLSRTLRQRH